MIRRSVVLAVMILLCCSTVTASASNPPRYALDWSALSAGGGLSAGGPYLLAGSIATPADGVSVGGNYMLRGGFPGIDPRAFYSDLYLPVVSYIH